MNTRLWCIVIDHEIEHTIGCAFPVAMHSDGTVSDLKMIKVSMDPELAHWQPTCSKQTRSVEVPWHESTWTW